MRSKGSEVQLREMVSPSKNVGTRLRQTPRDCLKATVERSGARLGVIRANRANVVMGNASFSALSPSQSPHPRLTLSGKRQNQKEQSVSISLLLQ